MSDSSLYQKCKQAVQRFMGDIAYHYTATLPDRPGMVSGPLLDQLFRGISDDPSRAAVIQQIPADAIVVYAIKHQSKFEYLFYHTPFRKLGIAFPVIGFNHRIVLWQPFRHLVKILLSTLACWRQWRRKPDPYAGGFFQRQLLEGRCALVSLVRKREFFHRAYKSGSDPLQLLIDLQGTTDRPVVIIPLLMFFGKHPLPARPTVMDLLFGPEQRPGRLRRMAILLGSPGTAFYEMSNPVNLKQYLTSDPVHTAGHWYRAMMLRRELLGQLNKHRQGITGPTPKTAMEMKQRVLTTERLQTFMHRYAKRRNTPLYRTHQEAGKYLDEIAARYSPAYARVGIWAVRWLINNMFEGITINTEMVHHIKTAAMDGPVVFVPCHRSHMDTLLVSWVLHEHHMRTPLIFAGKNLAFWPMGRLFRRLGVFFVRRSFKGAVFYAKVLAEYIYWLLREGNNILVFIEGTRSRSGKLLPPQLGMLSILLNACRDGACREMTFVPVSIGYDRVPEENAYVYESEGGQKKPENFRQLLGAHKFLERRYGRIYLTFNAPIPLSRVLADAGLSVDGLSTKEANRVCRELGHTIMSAIDDAGVVTPHALTAAALLAIGQSMVDASDLAFATRTFMAYLVARQIPLAETLVIAPERAIDSVLGAYAGRKLIEVTDRGEADAGIRQYRVHPGRRPALAYYQNHCIARFIPAAFTALLLLEKDSFQLSTADLHKDFDRLKAFFSNEFFLDPGLPSAYLVRKTIKAFIDDAILMPHATLPDTYQLTSMGYRKLRIFGSLLKPYLESYAIVLADLKAPGHQRRERKDRLKKIMARGEKMAKRREINCREAVMQPTLANALDYFSRVGIRSTDDADKISACEQMISRYLRCLVG